MGRVIEVDVDKLKDLLNDNKIELTNNIISVVRENYIPKDQYEARLKADLVAMLTELQLEMEEIQSREKWCDYATDNCISRYDVTDLIQQKIDKLKEVERLTNKEKLQEIFPNMIFEGTVMMYKPTEQVLASRINYSWLNAEYEEPTTKNDLAHNLCDSCINIGCEFQSGIVRTECAFYMPPHIEPDNCGNYVDHLVPRKVVERIIKSPRTQEQMLSMLNSIQSVTPQEPRWIPVSERLPETNIYDGHGPVWKHEVLITGYLSFDDKKETFINMAFAEDVRNKCVPNTNVTAWMPLPKPYREVEE